MFKTSNSIYQTAMLFFKFPPTQKSWKNLCRPVFSEFQDNFNFNNRFDLWRPTVDEDQHVVISIDIYSKQLRSPEPVQKQCTAVPKYPGRHFYTDIESYDMGIFGSVQ